MHLGCVFRRECGQFLKLSSVETMGGLCARTKLVRLGCVSDAFSSAIPSSTLWFWCISDAFPSGEIDFLSFFGAFRCVPGAFLWGYFPCTMKCWCFLHCNYIAVPMRSWCILFCNNLCETTSWDPSYFANSQMSIRGFKIEFREPPVRRNL